MKIINKYYVKTKFRVLKAEFLMEKGRVPVVGELITIDDNVNAISLVSMGKVEPADLPDIGQYLTLRKITLPGEKEKFSAEKLQTVELKKIDALALMLQWAAIPVNEDQWQPYNIRLDKPQRREIPPVGEENRNWVRGWQ